MSGAQGCELAIHLRYASTNAFAVARTIIVIVGVGDAVFDKRPTAPTITELRSALAISSARLTLCACIYCTVWGRVGVVASHHID